MIGRNPPNQPLPKWYGSERDVYLIFAGLFYWLVFRATGLTPKK